jgi:hypothetical protein
MLPATEWWSWLLSVSWCARVLHTRLATASWLSASAHATLFSAAQSTGKRERCGVREC